MMALMVKPCVAAHGHHTYEISLSKDFGNGSFWNSEIHTRRHRSWPRILREADRHWKARPGRRAKSLTRLPPSFGTTPVVVQAGRTDPPRRVHNAWHFLAFGLNPPRFLYGQ